MIQGRPTGGAVFFGALLACVGCSSLINPDSDLLGGEPDAGSAADAGTFDAGPFDAGTMGTDSGPVACEAGAPVCRGDGLVTCVGGVEQVRDCQAESSFCEAGDCRPWVCTPGTRACGPALGAVIACDARGTMEQTITCTAGACDPATNSCGGIDPSACEGLTTIEPGSMRDTDLCAESNDESFRSMADCDPRFGANAGDRIYALRIEHSGRYRIELEDDDILDDIDTVVYLRRQCDEERSQLACSDDTPCDGSFPFGDCMDGMNLGLSRIEIALEPGTYYIVVDGFLYDRGGAGRSECGNVELRVTAL